QVYVDDSESHTKKVMLAIASKYDPDRAVTANDVTAIIDRHHTFQSHLQKLGPCRVGIPYAEYLAKRMPAGNTKSRRAVQQVFTIIESLVLLMQDHREPRNDYCIATLEDYEVARRL